MLLALDQGRPDLFDGLQSIDYGAVVLYFIVMLIAGYYFSKRQKSTEEYFMAGRSMPWFVVGVSMFATLLSTVSYLSSPGEIIKNGLGIWGGQMHIPFTLALVTLVLIPFFMRKRFTSAYEYLETQYGLGARLFASILFMLNRLFWMGMIVYTASFAMVRMTGLPFIWVVVGIGSIAIVYTTMGGMRAVIWTDVAQFAILFAGLAFTVGFVFFETGTGPATWFNDVMQAEREPQPFFAFDPYVRVSLLGMAIYAMFWWTCTAGSDQVAIQRYLTTGSVQGARRSFASNLGADMTIALSLGLTGMALYSFYLGQLPGTPDQAFPHFIAHGMPRGLAGLVVAALFSAAMSSLDSGMHGVATVLTVDFFRRLRKKALDAAAELKLARTITILAGLFAVGFCLYLNTIPEETRGNLFDLTVRISSYITGALGGMFFAAFLRFRCTGPMMIASGFLGMAVGFYLSLATWIQTHPDIFIYVDAPGQAETMRWEPSRDRDNAIGSDSGENEFVLTGEGVAERHAVVRRTEDGWQLESLAGTRINDELVSQSQIRPDDSIEIAGNRLLVKVKAVSWMWVLPSSCLVTLFSAGLLGLFTRRRTTGAPA